MALTREEAWAKLCEWTRTEALRKHARAVELVMRAAAARYGDGAADEEKWGIAGMLHDADYEAWPEEHPRRIVAWLRTALPRLVSGTAQGNEIVTDQLLVKQRYAFVLFSLRQLDISRVQPKVRRHKNQKNGRALADGQLARARCRIQQLPRGHRRGIGPEGAECGKSNGDEDSDDGDDNQELDQGEGSAGAKC